MRAKTASVDALRMISTTIKENTQAGDGTVSFHAFEEAEEDELADAAALVCPPPIRFFSSVF